MATAPFDRIDAVTNPDNLKWGNSRLGTSATVSYSFLTSIPGYYNDLIPLGAEDPSNNFSSFTSSQKAAVREILDMYSEIANINFVETSAVGDITFGNHSMGEGVGAYAYYPSLERVYDDRIAPLSGDIWVNADREANFTPVKGEWSHLTLIHEIGHALGLKHPGDYNAGGGGTPGPYLPEGEDTHQYSVMSYNSHASYDRNESPVTPMLYDIAAMQYLYGANMNTRTGHDTYTFSTETEIKAIWDAGGWDHFDASNHSQSVTIRLGDGEFSSIGGINNVAIAYGANIESAEGGSADDLLIGNDGDNDLYGNAGDDTLYGLDGEDWLFGGAGNDKLYGGAGNDRLYGISGQDYLNGGAGNDRYYYDYTAGGSLSVSDSSGTDKLVVKSANGVEELGLDASLSEAGLTFSFGNGASLTVEQEEDGAIGIENINIRGLNNGEQGVYRFNSQNLSLLIESMSAVATAGMGGMANGIAMAANSGYQEVLATAWHSKAA